MDQAAVFARVPEAVPAVFTPPRLPAPARGSMADRIVQAQRQVGIRRRPLRPVRFIIRSRIILSRYIIRSPIIIRERPFTIADRGSAYRLACRRSLAASLTRVF